MSQLTVKVYVRVYAPPGRQFTSGPNPDIGHREKDVAITNREQIAHLVEKLIRVDGMICTIDSYDWRSNNLTARYTLPDENTLGTIDELRETGWSFIEERLRPYRLASK